MTFKEWSYECEQCGTKQKHLHWDTDTIPRCACGGELQPYSITLKRNSGVVDDTVIGGRLCETLGHEPFYYDSQSALRREAERRGLVNVVKHDDAYYAKQRKMHDEKLRDTGTPYPETERRPSRTDGRGRV